HVGTLVGIVLARVLRTGRGRKRAECDQEHRAHRSGPRQGQHVAALVRWFARWGPGWLRAAWPGIRRGQAVSASRGRSVARLQGPVRASSWLRRIFSQAVRHAEVEPGRANTKVEL